MKRFKVHIICAIAACVVLIIVRSTRTIDYLETLRGWKDTATKGLQERYEQTKSFVGREFISPGVH